MKLRGAKLLPIVVVFVLCLVSPLCGASAQTSNEARRVILISLDGLDARYLTGAGRYGLKIPTLRRLMREGATARRGVVSVYPSITYPAHTTIVTGARPAR